MTAAELASQDVRRRTSTRRRALGAAIGGAALIALAVALGFASQIYWAYEAFDRIERLRAPTPGQLAETYERAQQNWIACGAVALLGSVLLVIGLASLREGPSPEAAGEPAG